MKVKKKFLALAALSLLALPAPVFASEVDQDVGGSDTQIGVKIVAPPLWLMEISNLDFGKKYVGDTEAVALNDLTIKLIDNRESSNSLWRLSLKISPFRSSSGADMGQTRVYFDNAKMLKDATEDKDFQNESFKAEPNQFQIVTKQMKETGKGTYEYTVPAKNIKMTFPEITQPGKYEAVMDWVITDAIQ